MKAARQLPQEAIGRARRDHDSRADRAPRGEGLAAKDGITKRFEWMEESGHRTYICSDPSMICRWPTERRNRGSMRFPAKELPVSSCLSATKIRTTAPALSRTMQYRRTKES